MWENNSLSSLSKMLIFELVQTRRSACSFTSIMSLFDPGPFVKLSFTRKVSFVWLEVLRIVHYCPALLCFAVGFVFTFIFFCWRGRCTLYPLLCRKYFSAELVTSYWLLMASDLSIMMQTSVAYKEMKEMKTIQVDGCSFQLKHRGSLLLFETTAHLVTYEYCHWPNEMLNEMLNVMKCQMSWNVKSQEKSWNIKWYEISYVMKCQMSWIVKCHEM